MADEFTRVLVEYCRDVADELAPEVRHEAKRRILDVLGCAFRAFSEPGAGAARAYAQTRVLAGGSVVWGTGLRVDPETASLVNGAAVRYLDLNDAYFSLEGLHPGDMLAGVIAVAEQVGASGHDTLVAAALAYEIAVNICDTLCIHSQGWDHVNVTAIGACCGVARLMHLDEAELAQALSLTVVPHAAMWQSRDGHLTMWKSFAAADAVRHAVYACSLARAGVEGPTDAFEGKMGFINQLAGGRLENPAGLDRLREHASPHRILDTHIKVWSLGYLAQAPVECAELVRARINVGDEIESVVIRTYAFARDMLATPQRWEPMTRETADHSMPYVVAEMLRTGEVSEASFTPERFASPETHAFLRRVSVEVDGAFDDRYPSEFPAAVTVTMSSGEKFVEKVDVPYGHANRPMSDKDLSGKFHLGTDRVLGAGPARALEMLVMSMDNLQDIRELTKLTER